MATSTVLITGSNGEIGHELIKQLSMSSSVEIIATDLQDLDPRLIPLCHKFYKGNILDPDLIKQLSEYQYSSIYHLASLLSTSAEQKPGLAHNVNVNGTLTLLALADHQSQQSGYSVKFIYPSSIAVYGIPDLETKHSLGKIKEEDCLSPITMYGCNKLYCENLGRYYAHHYRQMDGNPSTVRIDFRALRFPGLISAHTIPSGGTSDYGPEMIHYAAQNKPYECFVRKDTLLPFMVMPDAVRSILLLESAPKNSLKHSVYNVTSFNPSAEDFAECVKGAFPNANIDYNPHPIRQKIVDSWPSDIDDSKACHDWGWSPQYNQELAFDEYLFPTIKAYYSR